MKYLVFSFLTESIDLSTTISRISSDITVHIPELYKAMRNQKRRFFEERGTLRGVGKTLALFQYRWYQTRYWDGRLGHELYDLCKYAPQATAGLKQFLIEKNDNTFKYLEQGLPHHLKITGTKLYQMGYKEAKKLIEAADVWIRYKTAYENDLDFANQDDVPTDIDASLAYAEKSESESKADAQFQRIMDQVLMGMPERFEIKAAVKKRGNTMQALENELSRRGLQVDYSAKPNYDKQNPSERPSPSGRPVVPKPAAAAPEAERPSFANRPRVVGRRLDR